MRNEDKLLVLIIFLLAFSGVFLIVASLTLREIGFVAVGVLCISFVVAAAGALKKGRA